MSIGERAATILAIGLFAIGLPVGFAIQRTWTSTHTAVALTGGLLALALGFALMSQALGVALADRRQQAGPPTIHLGMPSSPGQQYPAGFPGYDPLMMARLRDLESRVEEREQRRQLAAFGLEAKGGQGDDAEVGQFVVADMAYQDGQQGQMVMKRPEGGWER